MSTRIGFAARGAGALMWFTLGLWSGASAQGGFPDPNANCPPSQCGQVSPLIPMQSTEGVHMGLVWKKNSQNPKILFHARFPEYTPNDMADPALVDLAIAGGALTTAGNQFNSSLRDVLNGFDPFLGLGTTRSADDSFQRLTYGGYLMRQGLSQSVPTRINAVRTMERQLLFDISHPDAFKNSGKFHTALLDEADFAMNRAAFAENGYSKGMFYNTYCNARTTLSDGRVYVFGGHDMQSDNGLYKVNIFDPDSETWVKRAQPCTRANWNRDPFGLALFARDPNAQFYDNCDPRDQQSTQPSEPSDQKYARWYPSAIALPNDMVLVVGGFDQDNSVAPDPNRAAKGRLNQSQTDTAFTASRVNQVVPEVYDPKTDRNIALENARMAFPLYPQLEVVETGPGRDDWKVCTFNGEMDYGSVASEAIPGGAKFGIGGGTPAFTKGTTWCLDVLAALKDPNRNIPAKNHWTLLDTAAEVRPYCCPTASLVEIDRDGHTVSHKWFMISGQDQNGDQTGTVESIDFADARPRWEKVGSILQPLATTKAVLLPDGKVLIGQGVARHDQGSAAPRRQGAHRSGREPLGGMQCRWQTVHFRGARRPSLPDVRSRDRLGHQAGQDDGVARPSRHRDPAPRRLGVLRRREPRGSGAARRPVVPARVAATRRPGPRGSRRPSVLPVLPVQPGRQSGGASGYREGAQEGRVPRELRRQGRGRSERDRLGRAASQRPQHPQLDDG